MFRFGVLSGGSFKGLPVQVLRQRGRIMANGVYERMGRKLVRKGVVIDEYVDTISLPNGESEEWDFVDHKGAAAVVAVRDDGRLLMVRQWRNTLERETIELPAGGRTSREEPTAETAARELAEETGYRAQNLELLLNYRSTVAFCNEKIDIYLATGLTPGKQHLDPDEFLNVEVWDLDDLIGMIQRGEIEDGKTIAGIMAYAYRKRVAAPGEEKA